MPPTDDLIERLAGWLDFDEGPVMVDFLEIYGRMTMYHRFLDVVRKADPVVLDNGAEFIRWVRHMYGEAQVMALRRQADRGSRERENVQSLARMIDLLIEHADDETARAEMRTHRRELLAATKRASDLATTTLAHLLDRDTWPESALEADHITFEEIQDAIDTARRILGYYEGKLVGTRVALDEFIIPPWEWVFTIPWFDESKL